MGIISGLASVFGFWPVALAIIAAVFLGRIGKRTAFTVFGLSLAAMVILAFFGEHEGELGGIVLLVLGVGAFIFGTVTLLSYFYFSGTLGKLLTPKDRS